MTRSTTFQMATAGLLVLAGCVSDSRNVGDAFGSGSGSATAGTDGSGGGPGSAGTASTDSASAGTDDASASASATATASGTATATDGSSDSSSDTDDVKFDIGNGGDIPGAGCDPDDSACHCTAVDILFVIDNSGSMQEHASGVKAAFDTFVEEMVSVLPAETSLHVGLTRATGFYDPGNSGGWSGTTCEAAQVDGSWNPPDVANNGVNGQQGRLYEHQAQRFFELTTGQNAQGLKDWFGGALAGAIEGGWTVPHSNTETAVAGGAYPFHPANAAHNAGFMRQKAVLVIFLLSDSSDLSPKSIPTSDFVDMVSDAKAACGDQCILTTGAIPTVCYENPSVTNHRYTDFLNGFGKPAAAVVNLDDNTPSFTGVLGTTLADVIKTTCENIPPVG